MVNKYFETNKSLHDARQKSVNTLADRCGVDRLIVWLTNSEASEHGEIKHQMLASYCSGEDAEGKRARDRLKGAEIEVEHSVTTELENGSLVEKFNEALAKIFSGQNFEHHQVFLHQDYYIHRLTDPNSLSENGEIMVISYHIDPARPPVNRSVIETEFKLFLANIIAGRRLRYTGVLQAAEQAVASEHLTNESALKAVAEKIRQTIGAEYAFHLSVRDTAEWAEDCIKDDSETCQRKVTEQALANCKDDLETARDKLAKRTLSSKDQTLSQGSTLPFVQSLDRSEAPLLVFALTLPAYKLKASETLVSGQDFHTSLRKNDVMTHKQQFYVAFARKDEPPYLQTQFSEVDIGICDIALRSFQNFAAARAHTEDYTQLNGVIEELQGISLNNKAIETETELTETKLYKLAQNITKRFTGLKIVHGSNFASSERYKECAQHIGNWLKDKVKNDADPVSKKAIIKYFQEYKGLLVRYPTHFEDRSYQIRVHKHLSATVFEVLFGRHALKPMVLLFFYEQQVMTQASMQAFLLFLHEIAVILSSENQEEERKYALLDMRHLIVHQLSSAQHTLIPVVKTLSRKKKNLFLWNEYSKDTLLVPALERTQEALRNALSNLERERFMFMGLASTDVNKKTFSILRAIEEVAAILSHVKSSRGLSLNLKHFGGEPQNLQADATLMKVALTNLLENSYKYAGWGTEVTCETSFHGTYYRVAITNVGKALDETLKVSLMQTTMRVQEPSDRNPRQGTGLGLPTTGRILKAHDMRSIFDYTSSDKGGKSTTFFFEMPYIRDPKSTDHE